MPKAPYSTKKERLEGRKTNSTASPAVQNMMRLLTACKEDEQLIGRSNTRKRYILVPGLAEVVGIPPVNKEETLATVHDTLSAVESYLGIHGVDTRSELDHEVALKLVQTIRSDLQGRAPVAESAMETAT